MPLGKKILILRSKGNMSDSYHQVGVSGDAGLREEVDWSAGQGPEAVCQQGMGHHSKPRLSPPKKWKGNARNRGGGGDCKSCISQAFVSRICKEFLQFSDKKNITKLKMGKI